MRCIILDAYAGATKMNPLDAIEAVREAQASANLSRKPCSIVKYHGELVVMLKVKAVELGYEILETCSPILVRN
jgi:hypothetical protein